MGSLVVSFYPLRNLHCCWLQQHLRFFKGKSFSHLKYLTINHRLWTPNCMPKSKSIKAFLQKQCHSKIFRKRAGLQRIGSRMMWYRWRSDWRHLVCSFCDLPLGALVVACEESFWSPAPLLVNSNYCRLWSETLQLGISYFTWKDSKFKKSLKAHHDDP